MIVEQMRQAPEFNRRAIRAFQHSKLVYLGSRIDARCFSIQRQDAENVDIGAVMGQAVGKYGGSAYLLIGRVYDIPPGMMQIGRTGVVPFVRWQTWQRPSGEVRCDDHKKIRPFQK